MSAISMQRSVPDTSNYRQSNFESDETSAGNGPKTLELTGNATTPRGRQMGRNYCIKTWESAASIENQTKSGPSDYESSSCPVKSEKPTHHNREPIHIASPTPNVYAATEAGAESTVLDPTVKYAKKARHKVKADTYEYKGSNLPKKVTRKRKRRGGSMGNENFHAANVDVERVTLRPNNDQHLFSQERKCLPFSGHDLPDLTFTKMDYLSRTPQTRNPHTASANGKKKIDDYIVRRATKEKSRLDIPMAIARKHTVPSRSEMYFSEFAMDKKHNPQISESLNKTVAQSSHKSFQGLNWIKNESDPRVEEFRLPDTNRDVHISTPISWSTTPSRNDIKRSMRVNDGSARQARSLPSQDDARLARHLRNPELHTTQRPGKKRDDYSNDLTLGLLRRGSSNRVASSCQNTMKIYYSLEDLKRMSEGILGKISRNGSSALQPHIPSREASSSGQKSPSAPSPAHGPSVYIDDVIMHQCDCVGFPSPTPLRQNSGPGHCESIHRRSKDNHRCHIDRDMQEVDWYSVCVPISERPMQGNQEEWSTRHEVELPRRFSRGVSYLRMVEPHGPIHMHEHDAMYSSSAERQLDAFDMELLKTTRMRGGALLSDDPGPLEVGVPLLTGCVEQDLAMYPAADRYVSFSVRSPITPRLLNSQDIMPRNEEPALRLARPSLDCKDTQQGFNPFRRSCMIL